MTIRPVDPPAASTLRHGRRPQPPRLARYTIFTSGSTGRPKGVRITDRNLLNLVDWMRVEFAFAPGRRVLQYSTINFDASILDIFPTLLSGAALCIPTGDQRLSAALLEEFCTRHQIDLAFLPPALLGVLDAARFPALRDVLTGGEACSPAALANWGAGRRLYNLYGPTECTVLVSFKPMAATTDRTNIGQAIPGVPEVEIYEESTHIGGDGVGKIIAVDKPDYHSCMARIGNRNFELIEHHSSKGRHLYAHHNDVCGIHLAFMVPDIDEVFRRVKALGLEPTIAEPYTAHELGGYKAFFFRDLNGVQIEIVQVN